MLTGNPGLASPEGYKDMDVGSSDDDHDDDGDTRDEVEIEGTGGVVEAADLGDVLVLDRQGSRDQAWDEDDRSHQPDGDTHRDQNLEQGTHTSGLVQTFNWLIQYGLLLNQKLI